MDISLETVLLKLLLLQQRYNPIFLIISDQGTQLRNLDLEGKHAQTGETLRILVLLKESLNCVAYIQRANLVERYIQKIKTVLRTMGKSSFQKLCRDLKAQEFELLLAYVQNSIKLAPYDRETLGSLCPHDMHMYKSIICPIELVLSTEKDKIFKNCIHPLSEALALMIQAIKDSDLAKNQFFYNKTVGM